MNKLQEGKLQSALTVAHHDHHKALQTHAFFRLSNWTVSDDLVQDTFMKTWRYLLRGGKIEVMKAFLYHVLNHLIVDEYRKRKLLSLDSLLEKGFTPSVDPSARLVQMVDGKAAVRLIQHLPVKYQKVIRMRYVQDLSLQEMALLTGQTRNALAVQVHRGLQKLKKLYTKA